MITNIRQWSTAEHYIYIYIYYLYIYIYIYIYIQGVSGGILNILRGGSMVLKLGRFGQQIRNTWKVLKCGAGEGWKRSVGPIM